MTAVDSAGDLVGRDLELDRLKQLLKSASSGSARSALIVGDAGIGKTALLTAFRRQFRADRVLHVTGDEAEKDLPFGVVEQLLGHGASPWPDPFEAGRALINMLDGTPLDEPQLLAIDDLHLVDRESLTAVTFALRRLRLSRLISVFTTRTESIAQVPLGLSGLVHADGAYLSLVGLTDPEIAALAARCGHGTISARVAARLRAHTAGNPLHLSALFRELSTEQVTSAEELPVPRSFAALTIGTLGGLSPAAQSLAAAAAVLGGPSPVRVLADVAGVDDPLNGLEELHRSGLLRCHKSRHGMIGVFVHPLVRAAVFDDLSPVVRRELHVRAAACLGDPAGLDHEAAAAAGPHPMLVERLRVRASEQQAVGAFRAAAESLLEADRLGPVTESGELVVAAVDSLLAGGDIGGAYALALRIETSPPTGKLLFVQARMATFVGDHDRGEQLAHRAWEQAADLSVEALDSLAAMLIQAHLTNGDPSAAVQWGEHAIASGPLPAEAAVKTRGALAAALCMIGRADDARDQLADLPVDPFDLPLTRRDDARARGQIRLWTDDLSAAARDLEAAAGAPHYGISPYSVMSVALLGQVQVRIGQWDDAATNLDRAASLVDDMEQSWLASFVHGLSVLVPAGRGEWDTAEGHLAVGWEAASQHPTVAQTAYLTNAGVHLAACQQNWGLVLERARPLLDHPGPGTEPGIFTWPVHFADALVQLHRWDDAQEILDEFTQTARQRRRSSRIAGLARVRANLAVAQNDRATARTAYQEALTVGAGMDALEHATAVTQFGQFLRRRGERKSAAQQLQHGYAEADRLRARPLRRVAVAELECCGIKPTDQAAEDVLSVLTPQERTVVRLIQAGMTNKNIADHLVLGVKTIDYHVANVYKKLNVHSRSQLILRIAVPNGPSSSRSRTKPNP
jgi:DNA-binding CsgD family transcriptional regulator/tetratricopeptide (TPR) repeat protein